MFATLVYVSLCTPFLVDSEGILFMAFYSIPISPLVFTVFSAAPGFSEQRGGVCWPEEKLNRNYTADVKVCEIQGLYGRTLVAKIRT